MLRSATTIALALLAAACGLQQSHRPTPAEGATEVPATAAPDSAEPAAPEAEPIVVPPGTRVGSAVTDPGIDAVRSYTKLFYDGELERLFAHFSDEMKGNVPLEKLRSDRQVVLANYGQEVELVGEDFKRQGEYRGFVRWARFDKFEGVIEVQWILRDDDEVAGFFVKPAQRQER